MERNWISSDVVVDFTQNLAGFVEKRNIWSKLELGRLQEGGIQILECPQTRVGGTILDLHN